MFKIDCTGDVVTGDTILFTERVYAMVSNADQTAKSRRNRSRGHGRSSNKKGLGASGGSITLSQSIDGGLTSTKSHKEFVCERTVAAECPYVKFSHSHECSTVRYEGPMSNEIHTYNDI